MTADDGDASRGEGVLGCGETWIGREGIQKLRHCPVVTKGASVSARPHNRNTTQTQHGRMERVGVV